MYNDIHEAAHLGCVIRRVVFLRRLKSIGLQLLFALHQEEMIAAAMATRKKRPTSGTTLPKLCHRRSDHLEQFCRPSFSLLDNLSSLCQQSENRGRPAI